MKNLRLPALLALLLPLLASCLGGSYGAPEITQQPGNITGFVGQAATFNLATQGVSPLSFQWKRNGVSITGATRSSYTTAALTLADDGAKFSVTRSSALKP